MANKAGKGGGSKKIGRNKVACKKYKDFGIREKNKEKKLKKIEKRLEKAKIRKEMKDKVIV